MICWGVGCHPRKVDAQKHFNSELFKRLMQEAAVVGEVGLDFGGHCGHASRETQIKIFRYILEELRSKPRLVSIHSYQATEAVLNELDQIRVKAPILHWWTGNVKETKKAVDIGCYFSIHSAVARNSKFRNHVPLENVFVETDHGYNDPPLGLPPRLEWVEHLVAQQYKISQSNLRLQVWRNFISIVKKTGTLELLPVGVKKVLKKI